MRGHRRRAADSVPSCLAPRQLILWPWKVGPRSPSPAAQSSPDPSILGRSDRTGLAGKYGLLGWLQSTGQSGYPRPRLRHSGVSSRMR